MICELPHPLLPYISRTRTFLDMRFNAFYDNISWFNGLQNVETFLSYYLSCKKSEKTNGAVLREIPNRHSSEGKNRSGYFGAVLHMHCLVHSHLCVTTLSAR